jgi:hypothetical protein
MASNGDIRAIKVVSYSGYKANERPLHFVVDDRKVNVVRIVDRWYGEEEDYFKALAEDGRLYLLKWHRRLDVWLLVKVIDRIGVH